MEHTHTFESFLNESTEVSVEKITTPAERKALKNAFENIVTGIDKLSFKKDGTIEGKRGYFYRHGITPEKTAKELTSALKSQGINITVIDYYDDFKPWPKDSNFVVVFKISGVNESVNESVNEGAVKQFEADYITMVKNIKSGYGWIDPDFVEETWDNTGNSVDFSLVAEEVLSRLIKDNLLYFADDKDQDVKGKKVTNISQLK